MNELTVWEHFVDSMKNKYATFSGRASRKEYWSFVLFSIIVSIVVSIIDVSFDFNEILINIVSVIFFIPSISVTVRRLHDLNKSGWWYLIYFLPLLGALYMLYLMLKKTQLEDNQYGLSLVNKM
ncbi:MAG: DUF805 domain-containing protein [Veillonella caviae]|uniref:DUF805 domain-containing protein n=1 Tax=Veillonella caviae TaxID=248316 RepID=UPI002A917F26|nr:DUF805 domain-containing protein [Veillonella caviae]MDY5481212.1 DUF805 domain-containing protein [Veillonella caviae]